MIIIRITCVGTSPLLFTRMSREFKVKRSLERTDQPHPPLTKGDIASMHLYRDGEGRIVLPSMVLKQHLFQGVLHRQNRSLRGRMAKDQGQRKLTFAVFDQLFAVDGEYLALVDPATLDPASWVAHTFPFPSKDKPDREFVRPRIDRWSFSVRLSPRAMKEADACRQLGAIFRRTGQYTGLGWQPPAKESPYGHFTVQSVEQTTIAAA